MARSLGTLTIDVIAEVGGFVSGMSKSERAADAWRAKVEKAAKQAGTALGVGISAAVAGLAALTVATTNQAMEVQKLSQIAGVGTTEFQRYAAGAGALGVQQDKLADIFKDTQDKVGDFLQNGGGPMKDFFDNIAPKIGLTAKQFQDLSGPQALQLYVDGLQKAGVSQGDMVFYMEAIASDATALLPLLRDGGDGFKAFGDAAADAGAIIGEDTVTNAGRMKASMWLVEQQITGFKNELAGQIIPVIADLGATLLNSGKDGASSLKNYNVVGTIVRWVAQAAAGGVAAFELLGKSIGGAAAIIAEIPNGWDAMMRTREMVKTDLDATAQHWGGVIDQFGKAGTEAGAAAGQVDKLAAAMASTPLAGNFKPTGSGTTAAKAPLESAFAAVEGQLKRQIALFDQSADKSGEATELQKLNYEILEGKLKGANSQQAQHLRGLATELDRLGQIKDANEKAAKAAGDYARLVSGLNKDGNGMDLVRERLGVMEADRLGGGKAANDAEYYSTAGKVIDGIRGGGSSFEGPDALFGGAAGEFGKIKQAVEEEQKLYDTQLAALALYREQRADLNAQWDEEEAELAEKHKEKLALLDAARWQVQMSAAEDALGSVTETMKTAFGEQSGAYRAAFAMQKAAAIAQSIVAIQTGLAQAAANPWPTNLAAMASVAAATAGIISNIQAVGMAHDGIDKVPQTGTWLLQKGERVTTAQTSAKLDSTLDRLSGGGLSGGDTFEVHVNGNPDDRTLQLMEQAMKRAVKQARQETAGAIASGVGPEARALNRGWATRRKVS